MAKKETIFETPFEIYTSLEIIGEGGSGRVYSVTNSESEKFALKCLAHERITVERLKRFKNEIGFCQRNIHPNIIRVIDTGFTLVSDVRCPFYVMKHYSGTLRTHMDKLKPEEVLQLFSQILDGVEAAHIKEVWHRDLKPENVLWDSDKNNLVVADFGIAHFEEEEIFTAVETKVAAKMANFRYSAPEQRDRDANVDHRADIFSLGLILNEMFTGEVLQGAGYKNIGEVNSEYAYLDDVVEPMIQQAPENRPASIEEIKKELIGRKNEFVALQRYDEVKDQVVDVAEPPEFEPIKIVKFDYVGENLVIKLNRNAPPGWVHEFRNPHGGYGSIQGYGPHQFAINSDVINIHIQSHRIYSEEYIQKLIQQILDFVKQYVDSANKGYLLSLAERARSDEAEKTAALEKRVAEAKLRKNILSNVKL